MNHPKITMTSCKERGNLFDGSVKVVDTILYKKILPRAERRSKVHFHLEKKGK